MDLNKKTIEFVDFLNKKLELSKFVGNYEKVK